MPDEDCIFCKIAAGELPAEIVQEDEHTIAFMDINPWTRGHALVVPRNHSRNLYDAPDEDLVPVVELDLEHGVGEGFDDLALHLDLLLLGHGGQDA